MEKQSEYKDTLYGFEVKASSNRKSFNKGEEHLDALSISVTYPDMSQQSVCYNLLETIRQIVMREMGRTEQDTSVTMSMSLSRDNPEYKRLTDEHHQSNLRKARENTDNPIIRALLDMEDDSK